MRLLILSDLHRKIRKNQSPKMDLAISRPFVVVLAGDIDTGTKAVEWAARIRLAAKGYCKLHTGDTTQLHAIHRSRLQQTLGQPFDGKTVVITHMAPSMKSVSEEYNNAPVSAAYASRLEDSMLPPTEN